MHAAIDKDVAISLIYNTAMIPTQIIVYILEKIIPLERRKNISRTPTRYKVIKVLLMNVLFFCTPFALFSMLKMFKDTFHFSPSIYWIIIPLLFLSIPLICLLYNAIFYLIPPFRRHFDTIHNKYDLEKFKETNKKIFQSLIYFSPLFFVIFLGGFLSYKDYSETIVGTTILVCTIGSMTIMGTWLIKRTY